MDQTLLQEINNAGGRWNRQQFWINPLLIGFLLAIIAFLSGTFSSIIFGYNHIITLIVNQVINFLPIVGLYIIFVTHIKRLHDLNKSGWISLYLFVPLLNLYLLFICGFKEGTKGQNKYDYNSSKQYSLYNKIKNLYIQIIQSKNMKTVGKQTKKDFPIIELIVVGTIILIILILSILPLTDSNKNIGNKMEKIFLI